MLGAHNSELLSNNSYVLKSLVNVINPIGKQICFWRINFSDICNTKNIIMSHTICIEILSPRPVYMICMTFNERVWVEVFVSRLYLKFHTTCWEIVMNKMIRLDIGQKSCVHSKLWCSLPSLSMILFKFNLWQRCNLSFCNITMFAIHLFYSWTKYMSQKFNVMLKSTSSYVGIQDTKLEIHGCDGQSYHAVLQTRFCIDDGFPASFEQQMVE